jgi:NAD+ diphosphatase
MLRCPDCGNMIFPKISPAVIVGVTDGDRLLMSKYAGRDYTHYALIAGYTEIGETLEQTVQREVMEEVGLKVKNIRYYASQPWSFSGALLAGFFCDVDGDTHITLDENELSVAEWFRREDIPDNATISLTGTMMKAFKEGLV